MPKAIVPKNDETKWCTSCQTEKPRSEFNNNRTKWDGKSSSCKVCIKAYDETRAKARRRSYIERTYNITLDDYERMYEKQEGKCAICQRQHTGSKSMHVDHDHDTGKVRGLLCFNCNTILGLIGDCPNIGHTMADYLEKEGGTCNSMIEE